jgi:hypothetical protein
VAVKLDYNTSKAALALHGVCVLMFLASAGAGVAQDGGGLNVTFDITQSFENREEDGFSGVDGSSFRSLTTLAFGLSSETRSQSLALGLSSGLAATFDDDSDASFENSLGTLDYTRSSRNSLLSFGARYRRDEVDDLVFDATLADDDIATGVGQREVLTLNSGFVFGREARVTGTFNHIYETSNFIDTLDPTLNDTDTQALEARLSFRLTPVLTTDLFALWREVDEAGAGATDRKTTRFGTSASYSLDQITTMTAEISYLEEESRSATTTQTDGWNYALSVARERSNGEVTLGYIQEEALTGTRRQLIAGQSLTFGRGSLAYSLGVSDTEGFDPQPLASLAFAYETDRNSTTSITLSQEGTVNGDDEEVVNSRLTLAYARDLSEVSQVGASFDLVDENVLVAAADDQRSFRFDLTYDHALAQDWTLTTGYEYALVRLDGAADRSRSTVFLGLQKSFAYRP